MQAAHLPTGMVQPRSSLQRPQAASRRRWGLAARAQWRAAGPPLTRLSQPSTAPCWLAAHTPAAARRERRRCAPSTCGCTDFQQGGLLLRMRQPKRQKCFCFAEIVPSLIVPFPYFVQRSIGSCLRCALRNHHCQLPLAVFVRVPAEVRVRVKLVPPFPSRFGLLRKAQRVN